MAMTCPGPRDILKLYSVIIFLARSGTPGRQERWERWLRSSGSGVRQLTKNTADAWAPGVFNKAYGRWASTYSQRSGPVGSFCVTTSAVSGTSPASRMSLVMVSES
jgi:hypothetical protein